MLRGDVKTETPSSSGIPALYLCLLRNQRDIITNVADKNKNIAQNLQKGK